VGDGRSAQSQGAGATAREAGALVIVKPIQCCKCKYIVELTTGINKEGFAVSTGWNALRDHHNRHHPEYIAAVDAWIDGETKYKLPHDEEAEQQAVLEALEAIAH